MLSSSKHSPDDDGPHLAPVYWWDCKTGQYQAFCFTVIVVATVHVAEYTTIDIAVQCFLSSPLPSDSSSARAGDSYWAGKGVLPGSEALCSTGANSSYYNSTGVAFSVPIWDVLRVTMLKSKAWFISASRVSPYPDAIYQSGHFNHEQFYLCNIVDIIFFDFQGNRA